jgi:hypothetical protein
MPVKLPALPWRRTIIWACAALAFVALAVGPFHIPYGPYSGRNGVLEALDDVAAHRPAKLYAYHKAQIDYASRTPGLDCPDTSSSAGLWKIRHVFIDEASDSEGYMPSWVKMRRGEAARSFAYLYNITMLRTHRAEIERACPAVKAAPYEPVLWFR